MKENTVLHALMYIFKSQSQNQIALENFSGNVSSELSEAGFDKNIVHQAIQWILDLSTDNDIEKSAYFNCLNNLGHGIRIYTPYEYDLFSYECRQYILKLEQRGILSPANRERVITQTINRTT